MIFCIFSFWIVLQKIKLDYLGYLKDMWNVIDLLSNTMNLFVITFLISKFLFDADKISSQMLQIL